MSTQYQYIADLRDLMSSKLMKLSTVAGSVYSKLNTAQQVYNSKLQKGSTTASNLTGQLKGLAASYIGITAGIQLGRNALMSWDAQAKADAQLKAALISTNFAAGKSFQELSEKATKFQKTTLFGDEQVEGVQALMLTFKNVRGELYDQSIPAVLDYATAMKMDAKSAAIQLGKALNDPAKGLMMMAKSGVSFSESQIKMIKGLQETGRLAEAQTIILQEMASQFGGSAKAAAESGLGPWQKFMNQIGEYMEAFGAKLFKGLTQLMKMVQWVERNATAVKILGGSVTSFLVGYGAWAMLTKAHIALLTVKNSAIFVQIGLTRGWAVAQRHLNMTMTANPIGIVLGGVLALGTGIYMLIKALNKGRSVYDQVMKTAQENTIRERMDLDLLFNSLKKTNPASEERKKLVKQLNDLYPGLLQNMNLEQAGLYGLQTAYEKVSKSIEEKAKMAAAQDMLEQVYKDKFKLMNEAQGAWDKIISGAAYSIGGVKLVSNIAANKVNAIFDKEKKLKEMLSSNMGPFRDNSFIPNYDNNTDDPIAGKNSVDSITSGGTRPTNITINLGKFQDQIVVHASNVKEGASQIKDILMDELSRVLNSANYALKQ